MNKKDRVRFLKKVVVFCLIFPALFGAAGLAVCWHTGSDPTGCVQAVITAYTVELGLSCLTKITEKKEENKNGMD